MFLPVAHDLCSQSRQQLHIIPIKYGLGVSRNNTIRPVISQAVLFEMEDEMTVEEYAFAPKM